MRSCFTGFYSGNKMYIHKYYATLLDD